MDDKSPSLKQKKLLRAKKYIRKILIAQKKNSAPKGLNLVH
jgi:hypothetical protein